MHILIMNNQARALVNFWLPLLRALKAKGHILTCIVPEDSSLEAAEAVEILRQWGGVQFYPLDRKGLNPLNDFQTFLALYRLFKAGNYDYLYASTIKPVIYGLPAAALAGIAGRAAMITGLGYMFEATSWGKKILTVLASILYRFALSCAQVVFFQNADDLATFRKWHCLPSSLKAVLTKGTGVDTDKFSLAPLAEPLADNLRFLLVGRLLQAKGLFEYIAAIRLLKTKYPAVEFQILGPAEQGLGAVPLAQVEAWQAEGLITYLGSTSDVRPYIAAASAVVLPSWREGLPVSLMEAMSMGRAVVATQVPGCKDVVISGVTGFLVPLYDIAALAGAMEQLILEPELLRQMGQQGRELAETQLNAKKAADLIITNFGV